MQSVWPPFTSFRYCEHEFAYQMVNGTNIDLIILGVDELQSAYFIGVAKNDLEKFNEIERKIQLDCAGKEHEMVYVPIPNEMVMVKLEDDWHRCKFMEQRGKNAEVYCLDYGCVRIIPMASIRVNISLYLENY